MTMDKDFTKRIEELKERAKSMVKDGGKPSSKEAIRARNYRQAHRARCGRRKKKSLKT